MQCWQHLWRASCDDLLPQLVLPTLERTQLPHQRTAAASVGDEGLDEFRRQEAILQSPNTRASIWSRSTVRRLVQVARSR